MNEAEPITNYTAETIVDMTRRAAAGDPINFDRGDLELLLAELDRRGAAIERVRELHPRTTEDDIDYHYCDQCSDEWPCPTIAALDGE